MKNKIYLIISIFTFFNQTKLLTSTSEKFSLGKKFENFGSLIEEYGYKKPKKYLEDVYSEVKKNIIDTPIDDLKEWKKLKAEEIKNKKNNIKKSFSKIFGDLRKFEDENYFFPEISEHKIDKSKKQINKIIEQIEKLLEELNLKTYNIESIKVIKNEILKIATKEISNNSSKKFIYYRNLQLINEILLLIKAKISAFLSKLYMNLHKKNYEKIEFKKLSETKELVELFNNTIFKTTETYLNSIKNDIENLNKNDEIFKAHEKTLNKIVENTLNPTQN
jgi:hypothetical protein